MKSNQQDNQTSSEFVELENTPLEISNPTSFETNSEQKPINTLKENTISNEEGGKKGNIKEFKDSTLNEAIPNEAHQEKNNLMSDSKAQKEHNGIFPQLDILKKELEIKTLKTNLVVVSFLEGLFISSNLVFFFIYTKVFEISLPHYSMWDMCIFGLQILNPLYGYTIDSNFLFKGSKSKTLIMISTLGKVFNFKE